MSALAGHLNGRAIRMQPEQGQGAGRPDGKAAGQPAGQAVAASPSAGQSAPQPAEQRVQPGGTTPQQPAEQRVQQPADPGMPGRTTAPGPAGQSPSQPTLTTASQPAMQRVPGGKTGQPADQKIFRLPGSVVFWWAWVIFAVACLVDIAFTGHNHTAAEIAVTVAFITGVIYACVLRPRVVTDADAITVQNPLRDHRIPWGSVTAVDLRESVQVHCAKEPGAKRGKVIHSWALYAHRRQRLRQELLSHGNDRRRLPRSALTSYGQPSDTEQKKPSAAQLMATQLDELAKQARERGAAAGPRVVTWPWPPGVAIVAPAIALVLVITLFH
jgi:Bacterial PH domain